MCTLLACIMTTYVRRAFVRCVYAPKRLNTHPPTNYVWNVSLMKILALTAKVDEMFVVFVVNRNSGGTSNVCENMQRCRQQTGGAERKVIFNLHLMFRVYFCCSEKVLSAGASCLITRHNFIKSAQVYRVHNLLALRCIK